MAEPTYEELKARLAEMEKKGAGRRTGELEFKVGEGRRKRVRPRPFPRHSVLRAVDSSSGRQ